MRGFRVWISFLLVYFCSSAHLISPSGRYVWVWVVICCCCCCCYLYLHMHNTPFPFVRFPLFLESFHLIFLLMIFFIDNCGAPVVLWQRWDALHAFILFEAYLISCTILCIGNRLSRHMEHLVVFWSWGLIRLAIWGFQKAI